MLGLSPLTIQLTDSQGKPIVGDVEIRWRDPTAPDLILYADNQGTFPLDLPLHTTSIGSLVAWLEPGEYEWRAVHGDAMLDWRPFNVNPVRDITFIYTQVSPSAQWVIEHTLNKRPSVTVVDSGDSVVIPDVRYDSDSQVTIDFGSETSGKAYLN